MIILQTKRSCVKETFLIQGTLDFAHEVDGEHRFRTNLFRQRGLISLAARRVESNIPPFEKLHLPSVLEKICDSRQGLILVVGPTGCGKTTTIAKLAGAFTLNDQKKVGLISLDTQKIAGIEQLKYFGASSRSIIIEKYNLIST